MENNTPQKKGFSLKEYDEKIKKEFREGKGNLPLAIKASFVLSLVFALTFMIVFSIFGSFISIGTIFGITLFMFFFALFMLSIASYMGWNLFPDKKKN